MGDSMIPPQQEDNFAMCDWSCFMNCKMIQGAIYVPNILLYGRLHNYVTSLF